MSAILLVSLPADFLVWAASPEAEFLKGKLVWSNWDVEELRARAKELEEVDIGAEWVAVPRLYIEDDWGCRDKWSLAE